ncbi:hypothetical protein [Tichowtungia aerotolerans]|uniref:Uncharacterized protein n=1 Tax=Tichowtungia aerotolerans TaxID=2697043 RepID=A0A6P1M4P5_9BACT|nr:hypothetical protein [Tichowtungia aerotolerans]QHI68807.1 hypothetical protein GT409_04870 [Tichowtungia aerotolerans]
MNIRQAFQISSPAGLFLFVVLGIIPWTADGGVLRAAGGTVTVNGTLTVSNLVVESGAVLIGNGTVDGDVEVQGTINPGASGAGSVGSQTIVGDVFFAGGSVFEVDIASATSLDQLKTGGAVRGVCTVVPAAEPGVIPLWQPICNGAFSGDYSGFVLSNPARWVLDDSGTGMLFLTDVVGDSDSDQLPDYWEMAYFSGRTNADPSGNADSDSLSNQQEYIADTDPLDGGSSLEITDVSHNGNTVTVAWKGGVESVQYLEIANALSGTGPIWTRIYTNLPPTASSENFQHESAANPVQFYRIRAER